MSLPTLTGVARLIADPELRFAASGTAVLKLRLAFNSRRKEGDQWVDGDSYFVDGTVFKDEAEHLAEALSQGMEVVVTGRLKTRKYETREGEKRSATDLVIDGIGPSLKYATATVKKLQRGSGGAAPAGGGVDDPWASTSTTGNAGNFQSDTDPPF